MSLTKRGSRSITVENEDFYWQIRKKPTYSSGLGWSNLTVAIQLKDTNNSVLIATCNGSRPDALVKENKEIIVTPKHVKGIIKKAIEAGWNHNNQGSAFQFEYEIT